MQEERESEHGVRTEEHGVAQCAVAIQYLLALCLSWLFVAGECCKRCCRWPLAVVVPSVVLTHPALARSTPGLAYRTRTRCLTPSALLPARNGAIGLLRVRVAASASSAPVQKRKEGWARKNDGGCRCGRASERRSSVDVPPRAALVSSKCSNWKCAWRRRALRGCALERAKRNGCRRSTSRAAQAEQGAAPPIHRRPVGERARSRLLPSSPLPRRCSGEQRLDAIEHGPRMEWDAGPARFQMDSDGLRPAGCWRQKGVSSRPSRLDSSRRDVTHLARPQSRGRGSEG